MLGVSIPELCRIANEEKLSIHQNRRGFFMRTGRLSQAIGQAVYIRALEFFDTLKQQNSEPGGGVKKYF